MNAPVLSTRNLSRHFGAFRAVDSISLDIDRGSITGLIGPNGAGKSTLFNLLTGTLTPSAGEVRLRGKDVTGLSAADLFAMGLARTFQIPRPFPRMSVLENLMLAPMGQLGERFWGPVLRRGAMHAQERAIRKKAQEVLEFTTLSGVADQAAGEISGGQRKLLELARVLMGDPDIILLDEPAAGVTPTLTRVLLDKVRDLNRQGKTFVIVEHDMDVVMRHCEPVIALAQGKIVFQGTASEAMADPVLLDAYLGAAAHG